MTPKQVELAGLSSVETQIYNDNLEEINLIVGELQFELSQREDITERQFKDITEQFKGYLPRVTIPVLRKILK